jgi:hypothetical protein
MILTLRHAFKLFGIFFMSAIFFAPVYLWICFSLLYARKCLMIKRSSAERSRSQYTSKFPFPERSRRVVTDLSRRQHVSWAETWFLSTAEGWSLSTVEVLEHCRKTVLEHSRSVVTKFLRNLLVNTFLNFFFAILEKFTKPSRSEYN